MSPLPRRSLWCKDVLSWEGELGRSPANDSELQPELQLRDTAVGPTPATQPSIRSTPSPIASNENCRASRIGSVASEAHTNLLKVAVLQPAHPRPPEWPPTSGQGLRWGQRPPEDHHESSHTRMIRRRPP